MTGGLYKSDALGCTENTMIIVMSVKGQADLM